MPIAGDSLKGKVPKSESNGSMGHWESANLGSNELPMLYTSVHTRRVNWPQYQLAS
eukprot:CAMPEP_0177158924 /NCGR_PEP_ID=MMETSP0367-20130122/4046_1 /TAXON_ID=447022 ORGANISM="Scrippsiella hangoei-like, Strain SHHI-4" /NCGR_SAMPLE_ID=MMETSP0367 /ASSEMBLY_ACC=CAM_ASM_000362 /LENGTH=55 /DNA_ID=CAMNT_0018604531 /DNA_START=64 /DNA_END=228 /DNA_ORIENTATION=+